jgi:hypothetical protein
MSVFGLVIFQVSSRAFSLRLASDYNLPTYASSGHDPPTYASSVFGITAVNHHAWIVCWDGVLIIFFPGLALNHHSLDLHFSVARITGKLPYPVLNFIINNN